MRWSSFFIHTLKETPQEAQIKSHRLMLRSGAIRKLASGTYSYLPLGLRALQKATAIVREEMNGAGALELLLPALHPAELWKETGRFDILGEDMIHFKDRHGKENVLGPTHEEIITDLARREIHSYKQLPVCLYQIQTKFRDEMRPRSGVIRSREFIMKDAYSFHTNDECLDKTYSLMRETYRRIFSRCGLEFYVVQADPGAMGGSGSQEFVLFSDAGEDRMVQFGDTDVVMSVEMAARSIKNLQIPDFDPKTMMPHHRRIHTPGCSSIESLCAYLKEKPENFVKTMIYEIHGDGNVDGFKAFAVLVRGDHEVSDFKVKKQIHKNAVLASRDTIEKAGSSFGFSGPVELGLPLFVDEDVLSMKDFVVGANQRDWHLTKINWADIITGALEKTRRPVPGDFRQVTEGDKGPKGEKLHFKTAIELGHIFKLNLRYSEPMKAKVLDQSGKEVPMIMGCYGIGVNRILAAAIEQHADDKGIVWPKNISPFQVEVVMLDTKDAESQRLAKLIEDSDTLKARGIDVLVDDRDETAGVKFNDADLIGLPLRVILGPKNLKQGKVELKIRKTGEVLLTEIDQMVPKIVETLDRVA